MKKVGIGFLLLMLCATAHAQEDSQSQARLDANQLVELGKSLEDEITRKMPGWTHRSIQPIEGSQGVIIQLWQTSDVVVKVAVTAYVKPQQAEGAFNEFKSMFRVQEQAARNRGKTLTLVKEDLSTMGDEGFILDDMGSEAVALRKGRFVVNVSIQYPESRKDVFFSRRFAEHVARALERFYN